jgi:acetolactate synthase-1/2/3 large subunit
MESPRGVNDPSLGRLAEALRQADAVLLLGKRLDFTLKFGRAFGAEAQVVEAGEDINALASCEQLAARAPQLKWTKGEWREEVQEFLRYRPSEWDAIEQKEFPEGKQTKEFNNLPESPIHPVQLCREVQKLLEAPDAVLVCDGGEIGQWAQACLKAPHRVINGPAGSIGSAMPFAAAAKLAFPRSPVVSLMGDGTFGFHSAEIDTAVRYGLPYVAVVGNDACWNAEHQIQLRAYGRERTHALDLLPTRYGAVAAAFGAHGEDVSSLSELPAALQRARDAARVSCVNVLVDRLPAPAC